MGTSPNTIPDNNGSTIILYKLGSAKRTTKPFVSEADPAKAQLDFSQKYNNSIKNCQIFILKNDSEALRLKSEAVIFGGEAADQKA